MKYLNVILPGLLLAAVISCKTTNEPENPSLPDAPIVFECRIIPISQMDTDEDYKTEWEEGDVIGLFAVTFGDTLAHDGNALQNARLVYNGTSWMLDGNPESVWPGDEPLDFYAYYPYDESITDPIDMAFHVQADQSDAEGYSHSNLMLARTKGVARGAEVLLQFSHAFALLEVICTSVTPENENTEVYLYNVCSGVDVDMNAESDPSVTTMEGETENLRMYLYDKGDDRHVYRAWLPAQDMSIGDSLFMYINDYVERYDKVKENIQLEQATVKVLQSALPGYIAIVRINAGEFIMGSREWEEYHSDRETQHKVVITKDYYMTECEITNAQYAEFLNFSSIKDVTGELGGVVGEVDGYGECELFIKNIEWNIYYDAENEKQWVPVEGKENVPVSYVTWYGAKAYADWAGGSLPTEAQWEYACRAGTTTTWSFGDDPSVISDYAWCDENSPYNGPSDVGTRLPNPWGLYDMHGNLYEWCADWYDQNYGMENFDPEESVSDPTGPESGYYKITRGGSWFNFYNYHRSGYRNVAVPASASDLIGFRVVFPISD